ncbi:site-specific DNA-methyltransferase [Streptococcus suis]|uniref:site-specific DNA-methyltransferase n=1 Tax=Streptococcus suis TaxID=1307 RepID=UPI002FC78198
MSTAQHSTAQHSTAQQKLGDYTQVEKLDLTSKDILSDNIAKIGQLFPEVLTESSDENGRLRPAIDFDKLRQFLSREIVEGRESYEFTWVGKRGAIAEAGKPTTQTLRPDLEESVDFDKSENVFITGDNLEVLKVLQESYLGKIDMIYIDPPYNTGKDFVYSDKFQMSEEELADEMDLRDENGLQRVGLTKNEKSSARYHSDWLNMMYPRLVLARNLLKDSGVIFISIDDNEQANLKAICDEIFGEENFVSKIAVINNPKGRSDQKNIASAHEYLFIYQKSELVQLKGFKPGEHITKRYNKEDIKGKWREIDLRKTGDNDRFEDRPNMFYPFYWHIENTKLSLEKFENSIEILPMKSEFQKGCWRWGRDTALENLDRLYARYMPNKKQWSVFEKDYIDENDLVKSTSIWDFKDVNSERGTDRFVKDLDFEKGVFFKPKPVGTIRRALELSTGSDSLILDFFAGSATTADAVMQLNAEDGGNRKYILCTLDEQVADKSAAKEAGYETIDQISRERIRRAAKKIQEEHPETVGKQDFGFRAYKLDSSNFKEVSQTPDSFSQESLFDSVSNIKDGRTDLDLLFQIMLTWGMELSLPITKTQIDGTDIYNVADGALIACFADEISESTLRQIAKEEPLRAVFKDESFANSAAKINLGQIFKEEAPNTKVKVV